VVVVRAIVRVPRVTRRDAVEKLGLARAESDAVREGRVKSCTHTHNARAKTRYTRTHLSVHPYALAPSSTTALNGSSPCRRQLVWVRSRTPYDHSVRTRMRSHYTAHAHHAPPRPVPLRASLPRWLPQPPPCRRCSTRSPSATCARRTRSSRWTP
jgi:hypothetical protein